MIRFDLWFALPWLAYVCAIGGTIRGEKADCRSQRTKAAMIAEAEWGHVSCKIIGSALLIVGMLGS